MSENVDLALLGHLHAIVGGFGSGKSLLGVEKMWEAYQDGYRYFVTNMPLDQAKCLEAMPGSEFRVVSNGEIAQFWGKHPKKSVVVIDECQLVYKARHWAKILDSDPTVEVYFSQVRKDQDRLYVISQRFKDFPTFLRDRIQVCHRVYKLPVPWKWFLRQDWMLEQGKFVRRLFFFRLVTFRQLAPFGQLYDTLGVIGEGARREDAKFELPSKRRLPVPVWMLVIVGLVVGVLGYMFKSKFMDHRALASKTSASRVAGQDMPVGSRPGLAGGGVGGLASIAWKVDHYEVPRGYRVTGVRGGRVYVVGPDNGRVWDFPEDVRAEYDSVRSQVVGNSVSGEAVGAAGGVGGARGGLGAALRSGAASFRPGGPVFGRAAGGN